MGNSDRVVLVSGATGRQGGAVLRHMLPKGWKLRALTRNPGSLAAQELARQGIEIVRGDLEEPGSLRGAAQGAYGVFSVQDFWAVGAKREVMQGKNLADAAKKAGVQHFVYCSVGGAERHTGIDHWESKWEIEKHIRQIGLPATVLRPAAFMENYYVEQVEIGILRGRLMDPVRADKPYQTTAREAWGGLGALACEGRKGSRGREGEWGGSNLPTGRAGEFSGGVLGKPVKFRRLPLPMVRLFLGREFHQMFR